MYLCDFQINMGFRCFAIHHICFYLHFRQHSNFFGNKYVHWFQLNEMLLFLIKTMKMTILFKNQMISEILYFLDLREEGWLIISLYASMRPMKALSMVTSIFPCSILSTHQLNTQGRARQWHVIRSWGLKRSSFGAWKRKLAKHHQSLCSLY